MKKNLKVLKGVVRTFCVVLLFVGMTTFEIHAAGRDESVSFINLIATPERYHGKIVAVSAYVSIAMGDMSLCPTEHPLTKKDCLWLEIYSGPFKTSKDLERYNAEEEKWKPYHGRIVGLRGTFDKNETGRLGMWSGGIKKVTAVQEIKRAF